MSVTDPVNGTGQSTPVMLPWMLRVSAVAKLPNVPRHPRGESYSPWVLICAGGVLPGIIDVDDVSVIGSQPFSERMVVRNDCRFVCGTTSKVQVTVPLTGGSGLRTGGIGLNRHGAAPCSGEERLRSGVGAVGAEPPSPHADQREEQQQRPVADGVVLGHGKAPSGAG